MTSLKYRKNYVSGANKGKSFAAVMHNPTEVHKDYISGSSPKNLRTELHNTNDIIGALWYATEVELV